MAGPRYSFMKHWFAVEAIPIYVVVGGTVCGASWYLYRLAMGPTIQWTKNNSSPWNTVKPNQSTKLMHINHEPEERWSREKL
ncbi:nadh dehydrogenase [Moniliophthora roreri MCA 2997]|uniref:Nadh dehydrogenase n=2 Tax=Moniliophthora roreri TaxID=221103 RepID=V2XM54_MONRO|nr:nadh dehydrogenase [Moniliophthora roreri MCA 2997]KAI3611057.1 nadh dehydrogenase [Moniliophthora roreri]